MCSPWTPNTCAGQMPRSTGSLGRYMGSEGEEARAAMTIRKFLPQDAPAVSAIGQESPKAASWSVESYVKLSAEEGSVALVAANGAEITGFLIGRRAGDEAEVL